MKQFQRHHLEYQVWNHNWNRTSQTRGRKYLKKISKCMNFFTNFQKKTKGDIEEDFTKLRTEGKWQSLDKFENLWAKKISVNKRKTSVRFQQPKDHRLEMRNWAVFRNDATWCKLNLQQPSQVLMLVYHEIGKSLYFSFSDVSDRETSWMAAKMLSTKKSNT